MGIVVYVLLVSVHISGNEKVAPEGTLVNTCESSTVPSNAVCDPFVFAIVKSPSAIASCFAINEISDCVLL